MSVSSYRLQVLQERDFKRVYQISEALRLIRAWRNENKTAAVCSVCLQSISFHGNFAICCNKLYFKPCENYIVRSIAVRTPRIHFLPALLRQKLTKHHAAAVRQSFLVLPDPLYWQLAATLTYEIVLNFVSNKDNLKNCKPKGGADKGSFHSSLPQASFKLQQLYKRVQAAPLYHCSLTHRTQGKETFFRKTAVAKRAEHTARSMIVPAPYLRPNEMVLPHRMAMDLNAMNKWVIVNRMPSLSPDSFVALLVSHTWSYNCVGLPCEILNAINGDFDGDEVNCLVVQDLECQAECQLLLNSEENMKSFNNGLKLFPSQDMLVTHYLYREQLGIPFESLISFLTVVYETQGSSSCFAWFDYLRRFYLHATENLFLNAISFSEIAWLHEIAERTRDFDEFVHELHATPHSMGCLETQVRAGAKGDEIHIYMLVGAVGYQLLRYSNNDSREIRSSFLTGLTPREYLLHSKCGFESMIDSMIGVSKPGYSYFKLINSIQNVTMDYSGRLIDGNQILCRDALQQSYYEDLISTETFELLFNKHFKSDCPNV